MQDHWFKVTFQPFLYVKHLWITMQSTALYFKDPTI